MTAVRSGSCQMLGGQLLEVAWSHGDVESRDSAEEALVNAHELACEHLRERHVLCVIGLGPAEFIRDAPRGLDQTVGRFGSERAL